MALFVTLFVSKLGHGGACNDGTWPEECFRAHRQRVLTKSYALYRIHLFYLAQTQPEHPPSGNKTEVGAFGDKSAASAVSRGKRSISVRDQVLEIGFFALPDPAARL